MSSGDDTGERNPFAPPPADAPDQPWRPRAPRPNGGADRPDGQDGEPDERPLVPPPHPWSPGYQGGGRNPRPSAPQPPKLDPNDPAQRRARNAALAGMISLVCAFASLHYVALFVGALAVFWGVSAMRAPKQSSGAGTAGGGSAGQAPSEPSTPNPLTPAALAGILTGAMTVVFVSSVLGLAVYYNDYVTCVQDSLTSSAVDGCDKLAPQWYVDITKTSE
ncbi:MULTISPECIES: hypothetical protein [unclassified Streptomyces]|uniref:hypothetical protein n=1 Tax=Streptomycetaceae TaxID=2062 RepID=UPI002E79794C|nr:MULTISPECIES: hypothetical protein [unclassified Streptomyces]MED7947814.1 hypothetical protein [Streptomyces sp. BE303]MEE1828819.1 hypothetical protein [Streptomyces sp. BE20]